MIMIMIGYVRPERVNKWANCMTDICWSWSWRLDTWDRNGSTSGPTAWQIYDDHDHDHDWIRETGTGQQVTQLRDRYMMMIMIIILFSESHTLRNTSWTARSKFCARLVQNSVQYYSVIVGSWVSVQHLRVSATHFPPFPTFSSDLVKFQHLSVSLYWVILSFIKIDTTQAIL